MRKTRTGLLVLICLFFISTTVARAQDRTRLPGQIAYVGADFNIYTLNFESDQQTQLTEDAGRTSQYLWPTWSTDGRLAYFHAAIDDGQLVTEAFVSADGVAEAIQVYSGGAETVNYAYWSPGNCDASTECRDLAILLSSQARGLFVELVRDGLDEVSSLTAGSGGPFYYSWSPDGGRMLWQRGNQRLDIYDANEDRITETLEQIPGRIQAPAWSPVDDRLLVGAINDDETTDLVVIGNEETTLLVAGFPQLVSYNWSPDGNRIAYRVFGQNGYGPLIVVDSVTGETVARSPSTGAIAFFWSPDSRRIAFITLSAPSESFEAQDMQGHVLAQGTQRVPGLTWSILTVDTGDIRQFGPFIPSSETVYLLTYFDQFAQSHRIWSPDSRHLLYSELTTNGPVINVLDTSQENSVPLSVAEGVIGVWSFE